MAIAAIRSVCLRARSASAARWLTSFAIHMRSARGRGHLSLLT